MSIYFAVFRLEVKIQKFGRQSVVVATSSRPWNLPFLKLFISSQGCEHLSKSTLNRKNSRKAMATKSPYTSNVRVGVRVRPMASKELQQGGKGALSVDVATVSVGQKQFTYDAVFSSSMDQEDLYNSLNPSLLDSFIDGYNATVRPAL